jgi:hypothetical protein
MNINMLKSKGIQVVLLFCLSLFIVTCKNDEATVTDDGGSDTLKKNNIIKATQILYSLPSPIETAMLLKKAGAQYNEEFLNKLDNVNKYTTNKQMALNLGVYSADLSYASLYDQNQTSIKYMAASKKLADKLGILSAIDQSIINRLEGNVNNRDSIMQIISESFLNSNSYLKDNQRTQIAAIILAGGWIEGLYISAQLVKTTKENKDLINRIIDQKMSLSDLISMLDNENKVPNEDITSILKELHDIKAVFDKIKITSGDISTVANKNDKVTKLSVKSDISYKKEDIEQLIAKVEAFRTSIIK